MYPFTAVVSGRLNPMAIVYISTMSVMDVTDFAFYNVQLHIIKNRIMIFVGSVMNKISKHTIIKFQF